MSQATFWKERGGPLTVWAVELVYSSFHRNRVFRELKGVGRARKAPRTTVGLGHYDMNGEAAG